MARNRVFGMGPVWLLAWLLAFLTVLHAQRQPGSVPLGQVVARTVEIDGISVPSGTTVLSGNVIQTRESPAGIHLKGRRVVQLAANSRAEAEADAAGGIKLTLQAGTLSMRTDTGEILTLPAEQVLYFAQEGDAPQPAPPDRDVVAVLDAPAQAGSNSITVNDASRIDASQPILLRRQNGEAGEVHYIRSIEGNVITLTAPLRVAFPPQSPVLQGETTRRVLAEAGGGQAPAGISGPAAKSRAGTIALISGIGAGAAGLIIYQATKSDEDTPASPSQP